MVHVFQVLSALVLGLILSGCATIFASGPESIELKSNPPGATFQYGEFSGTTPAAINVPRKVLAQNKYVSFTKDGYEEKRVPLSTNIQNITWLGILFWPSILVDFATGHAYKAEASVINATLESAEPQPAINAKPQSTGLKKEVEKTIESARSQDVEQFKSGVVRITANPTQGSPKVGTGFVVRLEKDIAYIVTAAHVIAGDPQPGVEFFTKRNIPVRAAVLGLEGDDELRGLALVVVRGQENLPPGLIALPLASTIHLGGGQDIAIIGFPRAAGPWAVIKGTIVSRQGRVLDIGAALDEGNSGGPMIQKSKVVGMVVGLSRSFGRGVTAASVADYLDGFGITAQENGF